MDFNKIVAQRIMQAREQKGLYQKEIASALSLSNNAYNMIENGKTNITVNILFKISEILETPLGDLLNIKQGNNYASNNIIVTQNNHGTLYFQVSEEQIKNIKENKVD